MNVLAPEASAPKNLYVKILFYTPSEELQSYENILTQKDSQKRLMDELHKHSDMGKFRLDNNLAYSFKLAMETPIKNGRRIFIVANRFDMPPRWFSQADPREYPFTVITLNLDETGKGGGTLNYAAKIKFNKKHELEIVDTLSRPAILNGVQKDGD